MKIPVQNIYYLLCYAWNKYRDSERIKVSGSDFNNLTNLFAHVLIQSCYQLFKKGLDRNYTEINQEYDGIKGKIDFPGSLRKDLFRQGKAVCIYDEFTYDIIPNQLIKGTILKLLGVKNIDLNYRTELKRCYYNFTDVDDVIVDVAKFDKAVIHRNNSHYGFILQVCKLIVQQTVLDERTGNYSFKDILREDKLMASLFEEFVRNFYKSHLPTEYHVSREDISWKLEPIDGGSKTRLPKMQTDISISNKSIKMVIETKYYSETLSGRYDKNKYHSGNLYQIYAYLLNLEHNALDPCDQEASGILLYPTVDVVLHESYEMGKHLLHIRTLNLSQEWKKIEMDLLNLVFVN